MTYLLRVLMFLPTGTFPPLYVGWTLNFEMFFYALFALSFLFGKARYLFLYAALLLLVFIPRMFIPGIGHDIFYFDLQILNVATSLLLLYFLLGVIIGNTFEKLKLKSIVSVSLLLVAVVVFVLYLVRVIYLSEFIVCGLLVFSIVHYDKFDRNYPFKKVLTYLGDISYSIYLIHPIVIFSVKYVVSRYNMAGISNNKFQFIIVLTLTVVFAMVTHKLIERRFSKFLRKRFDIA